MNENKGPGINTNEWLAELDRVAAATFRGNQIVDDRGFTIADLITHKGLSRSVADRTIRHMINDGQLEIIGYRSGCGGAKVYDFVK